MSEVLPPRILCVDDEPKVLEGIKLTLRQRYTLGLAVSGPAGLDYLRAHPDTLVIVSDMRMPGMDGAAFLAAAREFAPDAHRILLTGHSDPESTMAAVNQGRISRFLCKPCEPQQLIAAIDGGIAEYRAVLASRNGIREAAQRDAPSRDRLTGLCVRDGLLDALERHLAGPDAGRGAVVTLLRTRTTPEYPFDTEAADADPILREFGRLLGGLRPQALCLARWDALSVAVFERVGEVNEEALKRRGQGLLEALTFPINLGSTRVVVDVTVGVVALTAQMTQPRAIMEHAELAERAARDKSAVAPVLYDQKLGEHAAQRRAIVRALREAITLDRLELHYQPIIDIGRGTLHSVEALARWTHPQLGNIPPGIFVPLAESSGLAVPLGDWTLRRICLDAGTILGQAIPTIAMNVSMTQLLEPAFLYTLYNALEQAGIAPSVLEIEVTESVFAHDLDAVLAVLADLQKLGIRIAIDDFGTGYSSLSYLTRLPVSIVKADGSFMRDFAAGGETVIAATLGMAQKFALDTIIEGVETAEMVEQARSVGATLLQGYHFARPMPLADLGRWCERFWGGQVLPRAADPPH